MERKEIKDKNLADFLNGLQADSRQSFLIHDGALRLTAIQGTIAVNQMRANFDLGPFETMVLGKAYIAGGLIGATLKGNDRIQLSVECGGPIGGYCVEAWACGAVRGYLKNDVINIPKPDMTLNELYGPGFLTVTKFIEGEKQPFVGQIMMENGALAKDLALYYHQSEQTPTSFNLSVYFDDKQRALGAGGIFIQVMPGCDEKILARLDEKVRNLPNLGRYLSTGHVIREFVEANFADEGVTWVGKGEYMFSCPCSRDNFRAHLVSLNGKEQQDILENGPFPLELVCLNCATSYEFSKEELQELFAARSLHTSD